MISQLSVRSCRLERDALALFQVLTQNYKSSIDRDPGFKEVSSPIWLRFLYIHAKHAQLTNTG